MRREATIERATKETDIRVNVVLDGAGQASVDSGVPFFDHMLSAFARHGYFDLDLKAVGDLEIDAHHTMEDIGLAMGRALSDALGDKSGITRFGCSFVPMDEALARVVVDLSGRPYLGYRVNTRDSEAGGVNTRLFREYFQALVNTAAITLHIDLLYGEEVHHCLEAVYKAFGRALGQAVGLDPRCTGVPSTKGLL
ncbi:MAG: imidazoleglycerol-phosphate dehydratase HisB [Lentisphaerae bacterium]|jgi:imidazoleglycerol-phosphate dehydratase|nr:imidazoleglycerol-phosphate dehydratase HisB [Lentisphaerota bacterium]MBT5611771.1 imidazoleglycerol-phosphate dehydratase HisB [Lentisphaerota bacterium]MBT7057324.1 imidazoleglycerol-phosphate dehydratase HisB [Lentisphaerota bacterium]MBT7841842.1 imidazoleglycerol-phosphate dehydratase HisB [Lentisphaerota bacterium]